MFFWSWSLDGNIVHKYKFISIFQLLQYFLLPKLFSLVTWLQAKYFKLNSKCFEIHQGGVELYSETEQVLSVKLKGRKMAEKRFNLRNFLKYEAIWVRQKFLYHTLPYMWSVYEKNLKYLSTCLRSQIMRRLEGRFSSFSHDGQCFVMQ